jgi:hypothetical protein
MMFFLVFSELLTPDKGTFVENIRVLLPVQWAESDSGEDEEHFVQSVISIKMPTLREGRHFNY